MYGVPVSRVQDGAAQEAMALEEMMSVVIELTRAAKDAQRAAHRALADAAEQLHDSEEAAKLAQL